QYFFIHPLVPISHLTFLSVQLDHLIIEKILYILIEKSGKILQKEKYAHDLHSLFKETNIPAEILSSKEHHFLQNGKHRQSNLRYYNDSKKNDPIASLIRETHHVCLDPPHEPAFQEKRSEFHLSLSKSQKQNLAKRQKIH